MNQAPGRVPRKAEISAQVDILLKNVADTSKIVFFVGAGASVPAGYPLWKAATRAALTSAKERGLASGAAGYAQEKFEKEQYYEVFEVLQQELPEPTFYEIASKVFAGKEQPAETHRLLARVKCRGIITTNFDTCLESASVLEGRGMPLQDFPQAMASDRFFVLKPHGSIQVPRSMVLSRRDWNRVEDNSDFREMLAQCVSQNQFVFIGYSMRDPDFNRIWGRILRERIFRAPAIYCCAEGSLRPELYAEFRDRNVKVVEFPDNGSFAFIPSLLSALAQNPSAAPKESGSPHPEQATTDLEHYVLICLQFSPTQQSRLVLVAKALVLETLALSSADEISTESISRQVTSVLGQDSPILREAIDLALREVATAGFITFDGTSAKLRRDKLKDLNDKASKLERVQAGWVENALIQQAGALGVEPETGDRAHLSQLLEKVLLQTGREVAELFLFNRPPGDQAEKIDETVEEFCAERDLVERKDLYKNTIKRMLFEPAEEDEDILFKKLQSYFIANAYVLDPTSERLLSQYARNHCVYFDSSVILPALAVGHPSHQVYRRLMTRTQALGMSLRVIPEMLNEVWANVKTAISAFKEFSKTGTSVLDILEGYVTMHGTGNGNVFIEGLLNRLRLDPSITPNAYMSDVLNISDLNIQEEHMIRVVSDSLGIESDSPKGSEIDRTQLESIITSIAHLRKHAGRFKTQKLCEHEARQFYLIHLRRKQNPQLTAKIWFVTTDRFLVELQRLEREKYPLPISYNPRNWFQYLDLIDTESRGSRHFLRLQPKMRFGVVSGELGIEAIRTILKEQRDLLSKGVVSVKELAEAAVSNYHVRQSIADYDRGSGAAHGANTLADAKSRIRSSIKKAVGDFVAVRTHELDDLKGERDAAKATIKSLEKKLAKEKYVATTLKKQQKARKNKKGRRR
jgi:NAD-dependent SIR2 family protein deacetylase